MSGRVIDALLSRGLLSNTVVTAKIGTRNRLGRIEYGISEYTVVEAKPEDSRWEIVLCSVIGRRVIRASESSIVAIDGMSIDRYADVYNINSDGSDKRIGKKRGRKPKNQTQ